MRRCESVKTNFKKFVRSTLRGLCLFIFILEVSFRSCLAFSAAQDQHAIFPVFVNQVPKGEVIALIRPADILARVSDLHRAGVLGFSGQNETVRGETYVSLSSLVPFVTFEMDEEALVLRLTVQPALLPPTVMNLRPDRPPGIIYSQDTSAFFNYAVNLVDFARFEAFGEGGLSIDGKLLFSSLSRNINGDVVRGQTNLTIDNRQNLMRWVIGDSFASAHGLGGSLFLAGIRVSREFGLDPYFYSSPSLGLSSAVLTPSTADIYVNGLLVRRAQLPPGQFELRNLPVTTGSGVTRVVIRDAFGREREVLSPFYFTTGVLAQGLHEYSYNFGFRRNDVGDSSWDYGAPAFLGRHRFGLTDSLTPGLRFEASSGLVSSGATLTARLPFGETEFSGAASHDKGRSGVAASLGYTYLARLFSFGGSIKYLSPHYATLSLKATDEHTSAETSAFIGFELASRTSLILQHTFANSNTKGQSQRISLSTSTRLTDRLNLFLAGGQSRQQGNRATELFAGLGYFFGNNTASLSYQQQGASGTSAIGLQKSLPAGTGFGYRFQFANRSDQNQMDGLLQYQGPYGRYEASYNRVNGQDSSVLNVAGGLAAIGGNIYFTRPIQESFALIRVPGVAGVRGTISNQEIGHTNAQGDLLVPDLLPYYGNRLGIADQDIPLSHSVDASEKIVAPPFRSGAVITFPVKRIQSFTGVIRIDISGKITTPAYGQLTVTAAEERFESPIGKEGEFYLENVPPGRHRAAIEFGETVCRFELDIPKSNESAVELRDSRCVGN